MPHPTKVISLTNWRQRRSEARTRRLIEARRHNLKLWHLVGMTLYPALSEVLATSSDPGTLHIRFRYSEHFSYQIEELYILGTFTVITREQTFWVNLVDDIHVELGEWIMVSFNWNHLHRLQGHSISNDIHFKLSLLLREMRQSAADRNS